MIKKGFTLIELLVVIGIIGLIAGIIIVNLNAARLKSRDGKRRADLASVQMAVETYADQNSDEYPITLPAGEFKTSVGNPTDWVQAPVIIPTYISVLPKDPKNDATYYYAYRSDGNDYKIKASDMESPEGDKWAQEDGVLPANTVYELFTAGAITW